MNISAGNIFGPENSMFFPLAIGKMHLDEFVSDLQSVSLVEEVWSVLVKQASAAGFEFVTYVNKRAGGRSETPLALSNFPAWWQEFYLTGDLIAEDIIFHHCSDLKPTLLQLEGIALTNSTGSIVEERYLSMYEAGFSHGFVSPNGALGGTRVAGWCFGTSSGADEFAEAYTKYGTTLRLLGLCAHERIAALHTQSDFTSATDGELSERERECLTHLARGQRSPHIAKLMGISLSTVEFHIKRIKRKLSAATREEAVAKALTLGQISYCV